MLAIRQLAEFLRDYGAWAVAALAISFAMVQWRAREKMLREYVDYLKAAPKELQAFGAEQAKSLARLERALARTKGTGMGTATGTGGGDG